MYRFYVTLDQSYLSISAPEGIWDSVKQHVEGGSSVRHVTSSSSVQNAEHSKSTAIIIRATLLWTLMVPVLLPWHIHTAHLRHEGVNMWIHCKEMIFFFFPGEKMQDVAASVVKGTSECNRSPFNHLELWT